MSFTCRFEDGDIWVGPSGEQELVSGAEKAAQDLLEEILLPYDASRDRGNEMFLKDGTLTSVTGVASIASAAIKTMIKSSVQRLMRAQAFDAGTDVSEVITMIKTLVVQSIRNDPTKQGFFLAVEVNDELIALARAVSMGHLGDTDKKLLGGYDP